MRFWAEGCGWWTCIFTRGFMCFPPNGIHIATAWNTTSSCGVLIADPIRFKKEWERIFVLLTSSPAMKITLSSYPNYCAITKEKRAFEDPELDSSVRVSSAPSSGCNPSALCSEAILTASGSCSLMLARLHLFALPHKHSPERQNSWIPPSQEEEEECAHNCK